MATLTANTIVRNPKTGEVKVLDAGTEVPQWAKDMVGEHLFAEVVESDGESGRADDGKKYGSMKKAELVAEINARNELRDEVNRISPEGKVADLIATLEADDGNVPVDESGTQQDDDGADGAGDDS